MGNSRPDSKNPRADRSHGGPGSSHQDAKDPNESGHGSLRRHQDPSPSDLRTKAPGEQGPRERSQVSGGGGEKDAHHTHSEAKK